MDLEIYENIINAMTYLFSIFLMQQLWTWATFGLTEGV